MIQLALGSDDTPVTAVYAHHRSGFRVAYDEVETESFGGVAVPVVFSARGSHASMLRSGSQVEGSPVPDHNDAKGPRVRPDVVALSETATPWVWWPGSWGGTKAGSSILGQLGVEANSPTGFTRHQAWSAPLEFAQACSTPSLPPAGQPLAGAPVAAASGPAGLGCRRHRRAARDRGRRIRRGGARRDRHRRLGSSGGQFGACGQPPLHARAPHHGDGHAADDGRRRARGACGRGHVRRLQQRDRHDTLSIDHAGRRTQCVR